MFVIEKDDLSFSGNTYSSKDSHMTEQMNGFIKKTLKVKTMIDKIQNDFKTVDFFYLISDKSLKLLPFEDDQEVTKLVLETTTKSIEICPSILCKITGELLLNTILKIDFLYDPNDERKSQELYERVCSFFDVLVLHDQQCRIFRFLVSQMITKIFESTFHSINFALMFNKILAHMHKMNVKL